MKDIFNQIRAKFSNELAIEGDIWRILRKSTFADLIEVSFFYFKKDKNEKYLIDVFNYSMKAQLLLRLKPIELQGGLEGISKMLYRESEAILKQYDALFNELTPSFKNISSLTFNDLTGQNKYKEVINKLKTNSYDNDIFKEITVLTYNSLNCNY